MLRLGWPARGTPEAEFPKTAAETAGGTAGENRSAGGVLRGSAGGSAQGLPGGVPGDCFSCEEQRRAVSRHSPRQSLGRCPGTTPQHSPQHSDFPPQSPQQSPQQFWGIRPRGFLWLASPISTLVSHQRESGFPESERDSLTSEEVPGTSSVGVRELPGKSGKLPENLWISAAEKIGASPPVL